MIDSGLPMSRAEIADVCESANSGAFRRKVSLASKHIVNAIISRGVTLKRFCRWLMRPGQEFPGHAITSLGLNLVLGAGIALIPVGSFRNAIPSGDASGRTPSPVRG